MIAYGWVVEISSLGVVAEKVKITERSELVVEEIKVEEIRGPFHKMKDVIKRDWIDLENSAKKPIDHIRLFNEVSL